jgi:hypothetical protein
VTALFGGDSESPSFHDLGVLDGSTATVTVPRTYDGEDRRVYVAPFDRFYLAEESILWPHWELVEHSPTRRDRLRFPAVRVELLVDSRLEEYRQDVDFAVVGGQIAWTGARDPGFESGVGDAEQRGRVYSAWYLYRPYWYVSRVPHAIRVVQAEDAGGNRVTTRMPFQIALVREQAFEEGRAAEPSEHADEREARAPRDSGFPPR